MKASEFEDKVWEVDGIRLVIRAPEKHTVEDYSWTNAADQGSSIKKYADKRIIPKIGGCEWLILNGDGEEPNGRTLLRTVRDSYKK